MPNVVVVLGLIAVILLVARGTRQRDEKTISEFLRTELAAAQTVRMVTLVAVGAGAYLFARAFGAARSAAAVSIVVLFVSTTYVGKVASYRPEGGPHLYDQAEMISLLRAALPVIEQMAAQVK